MNGGQELVSVGDFAVAAKTAVTVVRVRLRRRRGCPFRPTLTLTSTTLPKSHFQIKKSINLPSSPLLTSFPGAISLCLLHFLHISIFSIPTSSWLRRSHWSAYSSILPCSVMTSINLSWAASSSPLLIPSTTSNPLRNRRRTTLSSSSTRKSHDYILLRPKTSMTLPALCHPND